MTGFFCVSLSFRSRQNSSELDGIRRIYLGGVSAVRQLLSVLPRQRIASAALDRVHCYLMANTPSSALLVLPFLILSLVARLYPTVLWQLTDDTTQTFTLSRDNSTGKIGQIKMFILDSLSHPTLLTNPATI